MTCDDGELGDGPLLDYLGSGTQNHIFGTEDWVVAVPRLSVLSLLARFVASREWVREAREQLGGIAAPFIILDRCRFRARVPASGPIRRIDRHFAIARRRLSPESFLDVRMQRADPARALDYLERMLTLLERLRARGFLMLDFIMRNFVFTGETLRVGDPGLVLPLRDLDWHPRRISAYGFALGLTRDYLRLLGDLERRADDPGLRARLRAFAGRLPDRVRALRDRRREIDREDWCAVDFPEALENEIRACIGTVS